jgi:hypothetical protein
VVTIASSAVLRVQKTLSICDRSAVGPASTGILSRNMRFLISKPSGRSAAW